MTTLRHLTPFMAAAVAGLCLLHGCKKASDSGTDPLSRKPDLVVVTTSKDTVLTGGRDSSLWTFQLYQGSSPFAEPYAVQVWSDLGYFMQGTTKTRRTSFVTNASGSVSAYFYGESPGLETTLIWGDGYGIDTVRSVVIYAEANSLSLEFRDPAQGIWKTTDTLKAGLYRGKADSTDVRVTILDRNQAPVPGLRVILDVMVNGARPLRSRYGYFKSTVKPDSVSTGSAVADAQGVATDLFYTDLFPTSGDALVQIVAQVDEGSFGRIAASHFLLIKR